MYSIVCLMLVALILNAFGNRVKLNAPIGKFIKAGTTDYGLILKEDGTFSVFGGESEFVKGTYSVDGDIYTDESNDQNCPPMSFKFTFDGANLTFK